MTSQTTHPGSAIRSFHRATRWLAMVCSLVLATSATVTAQNVPLEDSVFTLGTVARDAQNRDWSFIVVQPTDPTLLAQRKLAVYRKLGAPNSPGNYERRTILGLQTDPGIIRVLLDRATNLGDNLMDLEGRVDNLFAGLVPANSLLLEEKLSAVIRGSITDPEHFENLIQLGRLHPAVNLCLGFSHAELIPNAGVVTYEVRDFDFPNNLDRGVVGRVSVEAGNPVVLPVPGPLYQVRDATGRGHLNAKLRWAIGEDFRRVSLLSYGFNLYRVEKAYAEHASRQFHLNTPAPGILSTLADSTVEVGRVNHIPALTSEILEDLPVAMPQSVYNAANPIAFVADDNNLARGGMPFQDGDQFYYFVAGRDLLGRDGHFSDALLVTHCDRIPPNGPGMPVVENHYTFEGGSSQQRLKVTWEPVEDPGEDSEIAGYYVYRWRAPGEIARFEGNPAVNRASNFIPHVPNQTQYTFIDSGPGAPSVPANVDQTFWYSVRAVDAASCDGGNLSPNSPPSFGVLRDREGPAAPIGGGPTIVCCKPRMDAGRAETRSNQEELDPASYHFDLVGFRADEGIAWFEFWIAQNVGAEKEFVGRFNFPDNSSEVARRISIPMRLISPNNVRIVEARAGDYTGNVTPIELIRDSTLPDRQTTRVFTFLAKSECSRIAYDEKAIRAGCTTHRPTPPKVPGSPDEEEPSVGIIVGIPLTPTTREFRLYRRVDYGELTLIKQGRTTYDAVSNLIVEIPDNDMPINSGVLCYYGQLLDEHGNPSPLAQLGECVPVDQPAPKPLLAPLEAAGAPNDTKMTLRWFCAPHGVERFEVSLGILGEPAPATLGDVLSPNQSDLNNKAPLNPNLPPLLWKILIFGTYLTPQPGLNFGEGASFELTVPCVQGKRYIVKVRPIMKSGLPGKFSNTETFLWVTPPKEVGPQVPWPTRPLPSVAVFHPMLQPVRLQHPTFNGIGIRIANIRREDTLDTREGDKEITLLRGIVNPTDFIYTNILGDRLLPTALYRIQIPNDTFAKVSGDVVQVSPLMESIARTQVDVQGVGPMIRIHDPFILLARGAEPSSNTVFTGMYLLDTQPVIIGARYAYLLVRFSSTGEVEQIIPTTVIDVFPDPQ